MARIQLRYSHNPQLIRVCQEIIIEQSRRSRDAARHWEEHEIHPGNDWR